MSRDPIEAIIREALTKAHIRFIEGNENDACLDFFLPDHGIYIEVKQFHSERISEQMSRADNVIAIQGKLAAEMFAAALEK